MNDAQIVGSIVIGLGALVTIIVPVLKLNSSIVELTVEMRNMSKLDETRDKRIEKHGNEIDSLNENVRDHAHELSNHETRLNSLERKRTD